MFWLTPLYLLCLIPVADSMANRPLWRWVGLLCFLFSVISATYPSLNPWSHPWIYDYWQYIEYPRPWFLERMTGISGS